MKKIMAVFGTRPEAIKMAPLVLALQKSKAFEVIVCVSGQHKEMLDSVLDVFGIVPDYNLEIMRVKQDLFDITVNILDRIKAVLIAEKPDMVLVHGDTSTAFVSALACFYLQIPVGHVEAGLRTGNLKSPFPEEFNRQGIGLMADIHFAPTEQAKLNLIREGKSNPIHVTGNTGIDALRYTIHDNAEKPKERLILLTAHRRENIGVPMREIFGAVKQIVDEFEDVRVVYPMHKNPLVRDIAREIFGEYDRVSLIEPLDVVAFHNLMDASYVILSDSGGIQEEAPSLHKPVLVLRDTTERPEGVEAGTLWMVGTEKQKIYEAVRRILQDEVLYDTMSQSKNPYGDGYASEKIVEILETYFK